jgi:hypothetical protein
MKVSGNALLIGWCRLSTKERQREAADEANTEER